MKVGNEDETPGLDESMHGSFKPTDMIRVSTPIPVSRDARPPTLISVSPTGAMQPSVPIEDAAPVEGEAADDEANDDANDDGHGTSSSNGVQHGNQLGHGNHNGHDGHVADDGDSAYLSNDQDTAYTQSATASIFNYRYENGRRYHAYREGQYVLPNDDQEQERLNFHHHLWRRLLDDRLFTAPLPPADTNPELFILDLGTGTGIWAMDMADEYLGSTVFGVDLSPIQPEWVPNNCRFFVDDYEDRWTYREDERFDFIHGRALSGSSSDWPRFYAQAIEHLKPGGWIEMQEYENWVFSEDDSCDRAPWTQAWCRTLEEASRKHGRANGAKFHKQWIMDAGFEGVEEKVFQIPIGPWAKDARLKELGILEQINMLMAVDAHSLALLTRVLHYTEDQARILIEGVKREFRREDLRFLISYRFIYGRRPLG